MWVRAEESPGGCTKNNRLRCGARTQQPNGCPSWLEKVGFFSSTQFLPPSFSFVERKKKEKKIGRFFLLFFLMGSLVGWLGPGGRERHEFSVVQKLRERHGGTGVGSMGLESRHCLACAALRRERLKQDFFPSNQHKRPHQAQTRKKLIGKYYRAKAESERREKLLRYDEGGNEKLCRFPQ